ncbi:hypothetical protein O9G_002787 [Rozella allomycis CSF55]|uniref:Uncharacterized protein n=1 Tax=Rozella allomycis (strain CSF55) TaxID=988480 RepID=A0A075AQB1_ROZAC|nr:hypothetical protein O9G_002787 [Rozella allomycis CSF55]|eukprot:EPZ30910.1 hypothetical protein O9G_002787 [Rozella allomycis CSF55]
MDIGIKDATINFFPEKYSECVAKESGSTCASLPGNTADCDEGWETPADVKWDKDAMSKGCIVGYRRYCCKPPNMWLSSKNLPMVSSKTSGTFSRAFHLLCTLPPTRAKMVEQQYCEERYVEEMQELCGIMEGSGELLSYFESEKYTSLESVDGEIVERLVGELGMGRGQAVRVLVDCCRERGEVDNGRFGFDEAVMYYHGERVAMLECLSALIGVCENEENELSVVGDEVLVRIEGGFVERWMRDFGKLVRCKPKGVNVGSVGMILENNLREMKSMLVCLFCMVYRRVVLSGREIGEIVGMLIENEFFSRVEYYGMLSEEGRRESEEVKQWAILLFVEMMNFENLNEDGMKELKRMKVCLVSDIKVVAEINERLKGMNYNFEGISDIKVVEEINERLKGMNYNFEGSSLILFSWGCFLAKIDLMNDEEYEELVSEKQMMIVKAVEMKCMNFIREVIKKKINLGVKQIIKDLLDVFVECFEVNFIEGFEDLVECYSDLFKQEEEMIEMFWRDENFSRGMKKVLESCIVRFPIQYEPLFEIYENNFVVCLESFNCFGIEIVRGTNGILIGNEIIKWKINYSGWEIIFNLLENFLLKKDEKNFLLCGLEIFEKIDFKKNEIEKIDLWIEYLIELLEINELDLISTSLNCLKKLIFKMNFQLIKRLINFSLNFFNILESEIKIGEFKFSKIYFEFILNLIKEINSRKFIKQTNSVEIELCELFPLILNLNINKWKFSNLSEKWIILKLFSNIVYEYSRLTNKEFKIESLYKIILQGNELMNYLFNKRKINELNEFKSCLKQGLKGKKVKVNSNQFNYSADLIPLLIDYSFDNDLGLDALNLLEKLIKENISLTPFIDSFYNLIKFKHYFRSKKFY